MACFLLSLFRSSSDTCSCSFALTSPFPNVGLTLPVFQNGLTGDFRASMILWFSVGDCAAIVDGVVGDENVIF